jgi:iron complex outermembrane recepter protein
MKTGAWFGGAMVAAAMGLPAAAQVQQPETHLPAVTVVGTTPLPGSGVDIDKVPSNVQTLSAKDIEGDGQSNIIPAAAEERMSSINLNDEQGSQYQPDFVYRGFEASPIFGIAQGLAVYQNGVRINESLGDTVNWDLVPQFAVNRLTVQSNNPVFGLNALGGAVTLEMKNGFNTAAGAELQLSGGSYGNINGYGEYAARSGHFGFYGGVSGMEDDGFRYHQPTALHLAYTDFGYDNGPLSLHLSLSGADNNIGGVGPTPIQMLQQDPRSVFTYPQGIHNEMWLAQLDGTYQPGGQQIFSADAYYRRFRQRLVDGNTTDAIACTNNANYFCLEGADNYPGDALYDSQGNPVPTSVLPANATPGETDHTFTSTAGEGLALQWTLLQPLLRRDNHLVIGASWDHGGTAYSAYGELGTLEPDLQVVGSGVIIDQAGSASAQPPLEEPVSVIANNNYYGVYLSNTLNLTPALAWTVSGRYNYARIDLEDQLGRSLNGNHDYARFNPGSGLTYKFAEALTVYGGYSQANRAPTAAELACSDPASPCLLDAFLVADPALHQVVSRTWEFGARGRFAVAALPGRFSWNLGLYRTSNSNDIILLATQVNGFGYFSNAGGTRRQGLETGLSWRSERWELNASYSYIDATFRSPETLSSNSPAADANGNIYVQPGDQLPMTPRQRLTLNAEYTLLRGWKIGSDLRYVSGQYLVGDESNQEPKLPSYTVVGLNSSYQARKWLRLFVEVDNLFDRSYYTYGTFTQLDGLPPNFNLSDPRTFSPAPGRVVYAGVHLSL